jgi:hypothetical protein
MMRATRIGSLLTAAIFALSALSLSAAAAGAATPAAGYSQFRGCPTAAEDPAVVACVHSEVTGGHFKMGNKDVPITNPITITGGVGTELTGFAANSEGGMELVKQKVPGGLVGLTGLTWLAEVLGSKALTLYAVTEVAGQPELGFTTISLPIRVHLVNPVLGNKCYVGSTTNPINLNLTTGTTNPPPPAKPITGTAPEVSSDVASQIISLTGGTYVDNSFSAPKANGCQLTLLGFIPIDLDGIVDLASGLPAAAGTNETVQAIDTEIAPEALVYP